MCMEKDKNVSKKMKGRRRMSHLGTEPETVVYKFRESHAQHVTKADDFPVHGDTFNVEVSLAQDLGSGIFVNT